VFLIISVTFFLVVPIIIAGCSTSTSENVLESNKQLVRSMNNELWNKGNLDRMNDFLSPDIVRHFLPDGSEVIGIKSFKEQEVKLREAFPDWQEDIRHIVAEGDIVVIHFVSTGTNRGSWLGKPPTGNRIRINEMSIFRIKDGKIAEQWLLPDILSMQEQLMAKTLEGGTEK
jgi:predicted ester cyclase